MKKIIIFILSVIHFMTVFASDFRQNIVADDIDFEQCKVLFNEESVSVSKSGILSALGFSNIDKGWLATDTRSVEGDKIEYLLVFKRDVAFGSMICRNVSEVSVPVNSGNISLDDENAWEHLQFAQPKAGLLKSILLPEGFKTRAVLFSQICTRRERYNALTFVRFFKERIVNITPYSVANANQEFIKYNMFSTPNYYFASNIPKGVSHWQNIGLTGGATKISQPPISEFNPAFFIISWEKELNVEGFYLQSNLTNFNIYEFEGATNINPGVATDKEWKRIRNFKLFNAFGQPAESKLEHLWDNIFKHDSSNEIFVKFDIPINTRGIKILITSVDSSEKAQIATISSFKVFSDIGSAKPEKIFASKLDTHPPYEIKFDMPFDGFATFVLNDLQGRRISNIFARKKFEKGSQSIYWDLKSINGGYVNPDNYNITAIFSPQLKIQYKMTPYPNVEMNNVPYNATTPWRNGHSGTGGWMSDHSPPRSVAAGGDYLYLGSKLSESGEALIACDLNGRRLWGHANFVSWTGPAFLTANSKEAFVILPHRGESENIYTIKHDGFTKNTWLVRNDTSERRLGVSGATCDDDKLYLTINANPDRFANAVMPNNVDFENSTPKYKEKPKSSSPEDVIDNRAEFARLFRLYGTPPGQGYRDMKNMTGVLNKLESTSYSGKRQHIVLAFKNEAQIGSLAFPFPKGDYDLSLSYLKKSASLPFDPNNDEKWSEFYRGRGKGWTVLPLPENVSTRALRVSFDKRDELELELESSLSDDSELEFNIKDNNSSDGGMFGNMNWQATLDGMKILRKRFKSLDKGVRIVTSSGNMNDDGEWDARRNKPITRKNPAIYMLEWKQKHRISGLAIKEIDARLTEIDYYSGPDDGPIDINADKNWINIAEYKQKRRYYYMPDVNNNTAAVYLDGYVDFGEDIETRAIRLRMVEVWMQRGEGREAMYGVHKDRGGMALSSTRCRVYGVTAVQYIGGEIPVDPMQYERLEVYDIAGKKKLSEMYLADPGQIIKSSNGKIYAISAGDIYLVDIASKQADLFTADPIKPIAVAADKDGNIYVYDADKSRLNVQVYNSDGNKIRSIGKAGGHVSGKWNPEEIGWINAGADIAIDKNSHLWIVEVSKNPKRVSQWTTDGKFLRDFFGNTGYGGGGCLNPYDKTKLYYADSYNVNGVMEFDINWKNRNTRLSSCFYTGRVRAGEVPIKIDGNLYLVTRPLFAAQGYGAVYLRKGEELVHVAAMGDASSYPGFDDPEIINYLGAKVLGDMLFCWSDINGDGKLQLNEVVFREKPGDAGAYQAYVSWFDNELGVQSENGRYEVEKFLANGVPLYKYVQTPQLPKQPGMKTLDGNYVFWDGYRGRDKKQVHAGYSKDGKKIWEYPVEGYGVHAISKAGHLTGEQVVSEFDIIGMVKANKPEMGSFHMSNSNIGRWNLWTDDGILIGETMLDRRDPNGMPWNIKKHEYDMDLTGINGGSEHFRGYFTKTLDGKYYIVAGHNFIGVLEVLGIDDIIRTKVPVKVTKEDVKAMEAWNRERQAEQVYADAKVINCTKTSNMIVPDGVIAEWENPVAEIDGKQKFYMKFDESNLYLAYEVTEKGPFKNRGEDWRRLFKTGACVDLQVATDASADKTRKNDVVKGDSRILISTFKGKTIAVLYQPIAPDAPKSEEWETHTMVFAAAFDKVKIIDDAEIGYQNRANSYSVEAIIPLESIGMKMETDMRMKMDWGILRTDQDASAVYERLYWSNKNTMTISDEAVEAVLKPDLWGYVYFIMPEKTLLDTSKATDILESGKSKDIDEEDILDELENF
jgi:hypothetical protein